MPIVRIARADEGGALADLILSANPFHRERIDRFIARGAQWHDVTAVVCEMEGKLVSCACIFHRLVSLESGPAHFSGIGAVATRPEYRRRGLAAQVLSRCEEVIQARGDRLAILFCSLPEFYQKLGWARIQEETLHFELLPPARPSGGIFNLAPAALPAALRRAAESESALVRSDEIWREYSDWRREDSDLCLAAYDRDVAVAYARGRRWREPPEGVRIVDAASRPGCEQALIRVLREQSRRVAGGSSVRFHAFLSRQHPLLAALGPAAITPVWAPSSPASGLMMVKPIAGAVSASRRILGAEDFRTGLPWAPRTWWGVDRF